MSESTIDYSQIVTFAQFAEKAGTTPQTVQKWAESASVKPVIKLGNTNGYLLPDLQSAMESFSTNAKAFKALGYVHPDQHKDVVDHRDRLAVENAQYHQNAIEMSEKYAHLQAEYDAIVAKYADNTGTVTDIYNLTDEDILAKAAEFGVTILTDV